MASKVYFTDMRVDFGVSLLDKLNTLLEKSGMGDINFNQKYAAIKMHFGEPGNLAFLRPNFAKTVADFIKAKGGRPYLTDCNTLYVGGRKDALGHLDSAYANGFSLLSTGCHILIGDGLRGTDDVIVPINGGEILKEARIGRAVMDADILISLTHFKGHECTGFGGALKNIGMGAGSRAGKMIMHGSGKVKVNKSLCTGCKICAKFCAHNAHSFDTGRCVVNADACVGCGRCLGACPFNAIYGATDSANEQLNKKMVEYAKAVLDGRPHFHISVVMQVSPYCDCHGENDAPIVPDIGMFASFDPVALDKACADAVNAAPPIKNSALGEAIGTNKDHFTRVFPDTDWRDQVNYAKKLNMGDTDYTLITI